MRFIQGRVIKIAKGEGGKRRLLLERKDGSEFVAVVLNSTTVNGVGTILKAGGFEAREQAHGRDVYEQIEDGHDSVAAIDLTKKDSINSQGIASAPKESNLTEMQRCSIELAAIINLTSKLMQQPFEEVVRDINDAYKRL